MRARALIAMGGLAASLGVACNFLVSGALDEYKLENPCDLEPKTAAAVTCSECIQSKCGSLVASSCSGGASSSTWFTVVRGCAKDPDLVGRSESCETIFKEGNVASGATGSEADRIRAYNCIRDNCLSPEKAPAACRVCNLFADAGAGNNCVSCLQRECANEIVRYCGRSESSSRDDAGVTKEVGNDTFLECLSPSATVKERCLAALRSVPPAPGPDAGAGGVQNYELRACGNRCVTACE